MSPRSLSRSLLLLAAFGLAAQARELNEVLKAVEQRYNRASTLQVHFEQRYLSQGRAQRVEAGELTLRKPGRMLWKYTHPAGKIFISDGKWLWFYSPQENRAERSKLKEADDFRAPLAFLLGKLDFKRQFANFEFKAGEGEVTLVAYPTGDRMPYTRVEFTITPDNVIRRLLVTGVDATVMEFLFSIERLNPPVDDVRFRFTPPPGAEVVEAGDGGAQ